MFALQGGKSYAAQIGVTCLLRWITNGRDQRINDIALETVFNIIKIYASMMKEHPDRISSSVELEVMNFNALG